MIAENVAQTKTQCQPGRMGYVGTGTETRDETGWSREEIEEILTREKDKFKDTIGEHILHIVLVLFFFMCFL